MKMLDRVFLGLMVLTIAAVLSAAAVHVLDYVVNYEPTCNNPTHHGQHTYE